jgi:hypothetical protein
MAATPVVIFLTTTGSGSWTVPVDWNPYNNTIEVIGGGAGGSACIGVAPYNGAGGAGGTNRSGGGSGAGGVGTGAGSSGTGGGGGGGYSQGASGPYGAGSVGSQGLIVITYTPLAGGSWGYILQ